MSNVDETQVLSRCQTLMTSMDCQSLKIGD